MTVKLLVATTNPGKIRELRRLLAEAEVEGVQLVGLADVGVDLDVVEDTGTFEGNARKKATEYAAASGLPTLADDSGLEVDAGCPVEGVDSAHYAGPERDDEANNDKLLAALAGVDVAARTARFRCVLVFVDPEAGVSHVEHGVVEGRIGFARQGQNGFGYDPLFVLPNGRTTAELTAAEKNAISHRGHATRRMAAYLRAARAERFDHRTGL